MINAQFNAKELSTFASCKSASGKMWWYSLFLIFSLETCLPSAKSYAPKYVDIARIPLALMFTFFGHPTVSSSSLSAKGYNFLLSTGISISL